MPPWTPASDTEPPAGPGPARTAARREGLSRTARLLARTPASLAGVVILLLLIITALLAPWIAPYDPLEQNFGARLAPPSPEHLLGTDQFGRDILSRIIWGTRLELQVILIVSVVSGVLGTAVGIASGYLGGWADTILMRVTDIFLAFPSLVLAMALAAALGPSMTSMILAIALVQWTPYARLARGEALRLREREHVEAARALGVSTFRIMVVHVLPVALPVIIVQMALRMGTIILTAASLGFLGLGAQPPAPEWGAMVSDGRNYLADQWWLATFPGIAIAIVVLGFNFLGDGVRDVLDPRER